MRRANTSIMLVASIGFLVGCGSKLPESKSTQQNIQNPGNTNEGDASSQNSCKLMELSDDQKQNGYQSININRLSVQTIDGSTKTLCNFARSYESPVMILQLAGVTCLSCMDEAKFFEKELKNPGPIANDIAHTVVFTDLKEEYEEADFKNFMNKYSPKALRAFDQKISLWKYFSKDPSAPTRPTIVSFNQYGQAKVINSENDSAEIILEASKGLFKSYEKILKEGGKSISPDDSQKEENEGNDKNSSNGNDDLISGNGGGSGNTPPSPSPTPPPAPNGKALSLTAEQNVKLSAPGSSAGENLGGYFEQNDFLLIDMSQYNCVYCRKLADKHGASTAFQKSFTNGMCKSLTVVPEADISNWLKVYPSSGFVGKYSRAVSSLRNLATAFKVDFTGTPTVFLINRKGQVLGTGVGETPSNLSTYCP